MDLWLKYRAIVAKYIINDQKRLLLEYDTWKRSEDSTRFWTNIRRKKTQLDAHAGAVDYVGEIVNEEMGQLCKDKDHVRDVTDTAFNEIENIQLLRNDELTSSCVENGESQATAVFNLYEDLSRFESEQDGNIYKLFDIYQTEATNLSNVEKHQDIGLCL